MLVHCSRNAHVTLIPVLLAALSTPGWALKHDQDDKKANSYRQRNLVSDQARGTHKDRNLVNAWGLYFSPTGPFWINANGTGVATVYNDKGQAQPPGTPLVVTIPRSPSATGAGNASPTGGVFNPTADFAVKPGMKSVFIFVTEDGTISGWNPTANATNAILTVDNSAKGAVYKGVAMGNVGMNNYVYVANFHAGTVEVYDSHFAPATLPGSFHDSGIPAGFAPFNIANLGGKLYVTYAKQDSDQHDDVKGPGNGFVDVFDTSGNLLSRFASNGKLNSPWGLTMAPSEFGAFGGAILVGNFGDGAINAFAPDGTFLGQLNDHRGSPIAIDGLWALHFGNGAQGGDLGVLYFTAGPGDEGHGLFGSLRAMHNDRDDRDDDH